MRRDLIILFLTTALMFQSSIPLHAQIFGFGFPPFRGGPLRHADDLGAARLVAELERLAERYGPRFAPCEVLQEQARRGSRFYS